MMFLVFHSLFSGLCPELSLEEKKGNLRKPGNLKLYFGKCNAVDLHNKVVHTNRVLQCLK